MDQWKYQQRPLCSALIRCATQIHVVTPWCISWENLSILTKTNVNRAQSIYQVVLIFTMIVGINKGYCWVGSQCSVKLQRLTSIWNFRGNNLPTYIRLVLKTFRAVLLKGPLPNTNPLIPWFLIFFLCWRFWGLSPCQSVPPPHTHPPIHEAKTSFTSSTTLHRQRQRSNFPMTNAQVLRQRRKYEKYKKQNGV